MYSVLKLLGVAVVLMIVGVAAFALQGAATRAANAPQSQAEEPAPSFHAEVPPGPLPITLSPSQFNDIVVQNAYAIAARVKKVLYQEPCYCHCDRSIGHGSLLDCFVSRHASQCEICMREGFYSYEQSRKGKTAAQIREGIKKGEWQTVDVEKYKQPLPAR